MTDFTLTITREDQAAKAIYVAATLNAKVAGMQAANMVDDAVAAMRAKP